MDAAAPILSKAALTLDLPPSCVQFSPRHPDYFVVGTYNLQKDDPAGGPDEGSDAGGARRPQSRNGSLVVFRVANDELSVSGPRAACSAPSLPWRLPGVLTAGSIKVQTVFQPWALLDLRFHPATRGQRRDILAAVSSTATLAVFSFDPDGTPSEPLQPLATSACADLAEDVLALQCCWHPAVDRAIAISTSTGLARLLHLGPDWRIQAHTDLAVGNSLEAWSIAFSPHVEKAGQTVSVYCGGDDSMLRYALCPDPHKPPPSEAPYATVSIRGQHDAGVTAILPLALVAGDGGRVVVTGSYDDYVRVFSIRHVDQSFGARSVQPLAAKNLGGGVWRLSLVDVAQPWTVRILASCMHAGARLLEVSSDDGTSWRLRVLARFEEHQSMNYASDFVPRRDGTAGMRCVSTSFYDRLLCLWDYAGPAEPGSQPMQERT